MRASRVMAALAAVVWGATVLSLGAGCGLNQLTNASEVIRTRVAAVEASPPEIAPGQTTQLRALLVHPQGVTPDLGALWFACLAESAAGCLSFDVGGAATGDDDSAAGPMPPEDLQFGVGEHFSYSASGPTFDAAWERLSDEDKVEGLSVFVSVTYVPRTNAELQDLIIRVATAAFSGDQEAMEPLVEELQGLFEDGMTATRRVTVSDKSLGQPGELRCAVEDLRPNRNPVLEGLRLHVAEDGRDEGLLLGERTFVPPGASVWLRPVLALDAVEDYVYVNTDGETECRRESPWLAWMSNAGSISRGNTYLADPGDLEEVAGRPKVNQFTVPEAEEFTAPIDLWVVARDRRGGQQWLHHELWPLAAP